jgi:hypothetical protein
MRKLQLFGLTLAAVFASSAFFALPVFAAEEMEYLVSGEAVVTTTNVTMSGTLVLEDMGAGAVTLECEVTGKGTVSSGGKGSLIELLANTCKTTRGTCGGPKLKVVGVPWATTIDLSQGEPRDLVTMSFVISCFGIAKDECAGETSAGLENMPLETPPDLLFAFDTKSAGLSCSVGGAFQGLMAGELLISAEGGLSLAIS